METAQRHSSDRQTTRNNFVLDEEEDERPITAAESRQETPETPGVSGGGGGGEGGGGGGGGGHSPEEQHGASSSELLYPVNSDHFFTAADGSPWLKFAPAAGTSSGPSERPPPCGSDFSSRAVLCLIEAVGRLWGLYDTWERSQLFQNVQEEMAAEGHVLPVEKIRRKWNNLIVTYKRVKERSRETGHTKTSWEFFDLMEATLSDTVGPQISNKRPKPSSPPCPPPGPATEVLVRPRLPLTAAQTPDGKLSASSVSSVTTETISPSNSPDIKPFIFLNGDIVASGLPSTATDASSSSSHTAPPGNVDLNNATRKAPPSGILPLRLHSAQRNKNISNSVSPAPSSGAEAALIAEVLKRQEERANSDRAERRRTEKRRERREQRMVESLGRVATSLELLSSKQDTVIALLQRLADKQ